MNLEQRLRRDARLLAGDPEALALFECLAKHVFDPALDATFMGRVCGATRAVRERVAAKLGRLSKYVTELRMEEGKRLMRDSDLLVAEVARRVGYGRERTFRRNFGQAWGCSPSQMRQRARTGVDSGAGADGAAPAPESETKEDGASADRQAEREIPSGPARRALANRLRRQPQLAMLEAREATELRFLLRRLHPQLDEIGDEPLDAEAGELEPVVLGATGDWLERRAANAVYGELFVLPEDERRFALLQGLRMENVAAVRRFHRFCGWLLPLDAEEAVRNAGLAVELVDGHGELFGEAAADWKAMAWVELARVQARVGDLGSADQALGFARAEVGGETALPPWVEIELRLVEGGVHQHHRRYREAARALDRAVELGRDLDAGDPSRRDTVLRRLELASTEGDAKTAFALLRELEQLIDGLGDDDGASLWRGFVLLHGARAYAVTGDDLRAKRCLMRVSRDLANDPAYASDRRLGILLTYAMHDLGRLWDDRPDFAEPLLRLAAENYRHFDLPALETAAEAELAVVCALLGRRAEARQLAASAADFLDQLPPLHREAWNASRRLRALARSGARVGEAELKELLAALRDDLDLAAWEIPDPQARAVARARRARAEGDEPGVAEPPWESAPAP